MTETSTYCIGRFLVSVPKPLQLVSTDASIRNVQFERVGHGDEREAERLTTQRIRALQEGTVVEDSILQIFRSAVNVGTITIISRWDDLSSVGMEPTEPWSEESYVASGGVIFRLSSVATESSVRMRHANMSAVAKAIRPRQPNEIPPGVGLCASEDVYVSLPKGTGLYHASFADQTLGNLTIDILERGSDDTPFTPSETFEGPTDPVMIAGVEGEQQCLMRENQAFFQAIVSDLDSSGRNGSVLDIELNVRDQSNLPSEIGDANALWNKIVHTIQWKP